MLGVFWKIQEICSKTGTRISKIDGEMSEIIEPKVGNPENSISRNWATLSHPWNLTFFENDIFKLSSYLYGLKVPDIFCEVLHRFSKKCFQFITNYIIFHNNAAKIVGGEGFPSEWTEISAYSIFQFSDHCKWKGLGKDIIENKKTVEYILKIPHYM